MRRKSFLKDLVNRNTQKRFLIKNAKSIEAIARELLYIMEDNFNLINYFDEQLYLNMET